MRRRLRIRDEASRIRHDLGQVAGFLRDVWKRSHPTEAPPAVTSGFAGEYDAAAALEVVRASYDELLGFYHHIDEKLRSLITALAFLTASGITLFVFGAGDRLADLRFDGRSWNVANVFFVAFLGCVALSLSSALVALDPTTHRPHFLSGEAPNLASAIYYQAIVDGTRRDWWKTGEEPVALRTAQELLIGSYRRDAWEVARRTRHKAQRSQNAEALMSVAIVALLVLGITRLPQSTALTRERMIVGFLVAFTIFPLFTALRMRDAGIPALARDDLPRLGFDLVRGTVFYVLPGLAAVGLAALSLADERAVWPTLFYALGWIIVGRLASYSRWGHLIAALATIVGFALLTTSVVNPGAFWGGTLIVDRSDALRPLGGVQHQIICLRVHGRPHRKVRVLVTAIGSEPPKRSFSLQLDGEGIGRRSLDLGSEAAYTGTVDVRQPPKGDFVHLTFAVPSTATSALELPFRCPPL